MPASVSGVAKRYAEAVFQIAVAKGTFDKWSSDLEAIAEVQRVPEVLRLISAPAIAMSAKEAVINRSLEGVSPEAGNLVRMLLHKGRFAQATRIAEEYRALVNEHRGIATARVTSAVPLSQQEIAAVGQRLSAMSGRQVVVETQVDPSIIGGIVARIGDQLIDASVKGRLEALKKQLATR